MEREAYEEIGGLRYSVYDFLSRPESPYLLFMPATIPAADPFADPESLTGLMLEESDVLVASRTASSVSDLLLPGGNLIGKAGSKASIREVQGGIAEAQSLFDALTKGGQIIESPTFPGTQIKLPNGDIFGLRTVMARSPNTVATIDVNSKAVPAISKVKFNP